VRCRGVPSPAVLALSGWGYADFHAAVNFAQTEFSEVRTQKKGAGQALIVLLAVWWSWNYTTWTTNDRFRYTAEDWFPGFPKGWKWLVIETLKVGMLEMVILCVGSERKGDPKSHGTNPVSRILGHAKPGEPDV
jgi:hypothetical protein